MKIKLLLLLVALVILNGLPATHAQTGITEVVRTTHKGRIKVYHLNAEEKKTCAPAQMGVHTFTCLAVQTDRSPFTGRLFTRKHAASGSKVPLVEIPGLSGLFSVNNDCQCWEQ